jgi:transposase
MWTSKNRARYKRNYLRYPSDVTDEEWAHIGPLIPPAKRGGRKREVDARDIVDGIMYVLSTGCQWRYIPKDLPARSTVYRYFCLWGIPRHAGLHPLRALREVSRAGGTRSQPHRCHHRQPEREKRRKRRTLYRSAWVRRGQAHQGQEAAYLGRYTRSVAACDCSSGRYSGSRRWHPAAVHAFRPVSFSEKTLC